MNYEKKRKRQSGRQSAINSLYSAEYYEYVNSYEVRICAIKETLEQLINDGFLSADDFCHAVTLDKRLIDK